MVGPRDSHVTILLSTFSGASWLPELLASLDAQTHHNWTLIARDDGSTDNTVDLLEAAADHDPRIRVHRDDLGNLGPAASFMSLLAMLPAAEDGTVNELFAFCDQDDIWHPDKLERSIAALPAAPLAAVYTDANVTNAEGVVTAPSALHERGVAAGTDVPFGHLLITNAAIGATMLGTAALGRTAHTLAADEDILMHDWWVALVASHEESLACLHEPTIFWRRHATTVTGATPSGMKARAARRLHYLAWSVRAAQLLQRSELVGSAATQTATAALGAVDPEQPSLRSMLGVWRRGVGAWPGRGQLSLLFSVLIGKTAQ